MSSQPNLSDDAIHVTTNETGKVYTIDGVTIEFPFMAYASQISIMCKIIKSLQKKQNCLLESPTGSGKSLVLLCAALAWQKQETEKVNHVSSRMCDKARIQTASIPKIFYCTRTHKQITQVVQELAKTCHKNVAMSILSSREQTCIHPIVSTEMNKKEHCEQRIRSNNQHETCEYYSSSLSMNHETLKQYGFPMIWDLEDLVQFGQSKKCCPYFSLRELMNNADIIFCPYNYLTDPLIRSSLDIIINDQIIIFDEAHCIEDFAREATSMSVTQDTLIQVIRDLESTPGTKEFTSIFSKLSTWVARTTRYSNPVFTGQKLVQLLTDFGAGPKTFSLLSSQLHQLIQTNEQEKLFKNTSLSNTALEILRKFVLILNFCYRDNLKFMTDYRCVVIVETQAKVLNFWCMNPAVCFSDFQNVHSLIVTSGTLSPILSFQSELHLPFPHMIQTNHVIEPSQIWVGTIASGPSGILLRSIYTKINTVEYQDELGECILKICQTVPAGILCFLPSYHVLEKCKFRWETTGLLNRLKIMKPFVAVEPRENKKFEPLLTSYYSTIKNGQGALFFAVYRGKVSEGLNFSDYHARAVITVGIPYPNVYDLQIKLKRAYNDKYCTERELMDGDMWYEIQAYRALNQALGRCIRHSHDWGALIMIDQRFQLDEKYIKLISKWIRKELQHYYTFSEAIHSLNDFIKNNDSM